jgi:hypothetical protein
MLRPPRVEDAEGSPALVVADEDRAAIEDLVAELLMAVLEAAEVVEPAA